MTKRSKGEPQDLIAVRVLAEQRWAYEQRLAHLSYREMSMRTIRPEDEGGLGYYLSASALKARVTKYREDMREALTEDREEHRERELADLDLVQRLALEAMRKGAALGVLDDKASTLYLKAGAERRKLLGLDAPVESKVDVTVHDAVTDELNAMLAEAGIPPIESETRP